MLCDVYPLRSRGRKIPPEEVRAGGRRGWLELVPERDDGAPVKIAIFRSRRGTVCGQLTSAQVTRITKEGLMVTGWEMPPGQHRQAWWCVLVTGGE